MKRDLYTEVSARILQELERGAAPWVKPWSATPGQNVPCNAATNRPYSGCNVILLWLAKGRGWSTPRFLTFKQAQSLGGNVKKGEHGTKVYFVKKLTIEDKSPDAKPGDVRSFPMLREYTVFNVDQCENLPARVLGIAPVKVRNPDERDATIDEFIASTKADIRENAGEAYYAPGGDFISRPAFAGFKNAANYYSVSFHEMAHWTGHKSRLDRADGMKGRFGDKAYAAEELVAELTAAFLCAEFSLDGELRHAGYIGNWIALLKDDSKAFFTACSKAQKAADFMRGLALQDDAAPEELAA